MPLGFSWAEGGGSFTVLHNGWAGKCDETLFLGFLFPILRSVAFFFPYLLDNEWTFGLLRQIHCLLLSFFPGLAHQPGWQPFLYCYCFAPDILFLSLLLSVRAVVCVSPCQVFVQQRKPAWAKVFWQPVDVGLCLQPLSLCCPDNILSVLAILGSTRERRFPGWRREKNDFLGFGTVWLTLMDFGFPTTNLLRKPDKRSMAKYVWQRVKERAREIENVSNFCFVFLPVA